MAFFDLFKRKPAAKPASKPFVMPPGLVPNQAPVPAPAAPPAAREPAIPAPVELPADVQSEAAQVPAEPAQPDHDGPERRERNRRHARPGLRVLVIDDSPTIVALLKRMLQQNQLVVLEAFDAESGIEIARKEVPDLIFLDIVLPGMDGFNALRTLRRDPITKHLPIIMISGNAQATEQFYVQRIGADDFMKKPFSRAEVFMRIEALLDAENIPRHGSKPGTRAEAAAAAGQG
ncbi:PleD family two-component system response regulator [Thermomonas sp.]|uniref:response regulator n=1 Tax=Thermomonas sp. TaxID=1971895 RepID=UPI0035AFCB4E